MQDRECIVFEWTSDTDQRIYEPCVCLWVLCSSHLQPIVRWIIFILWDICRICPLEFFIACQKNTNAANFFCVFEAQWLGRSQWRTIHFFSFKKRPNISLYVEYSRTLLWFFEDFKSAYKATKFYARWLVRITVLRTKTCTNFTSQRNLLRKVGISNCLCSRTG